MEWKTWASLPLTQREQLPAHSGIYVVVDAEEQVWYVGQSVNINARWSGKGHHRYQQLSRTNNKRLYRIYWQLFPSHQLIEKEQFYIDLFKPHLNYSPVKNYARKAIQPNEELSRLIKVINKKTLLFPTVRSVVLGYYVEIDEDEAGLLQEYACIVIAVSVNDHDGPILNSYDKSHRRKGNHLKGCWYIYENPCGSDRPDLKPAFIPTFRVNNLIYEFVCCPSLIENLEQNSNNLHNTELVDVELAKQTVLALKDPEALPSLLITDRHCTFRSEDYLRYRGKDLQSIRLLLPASVGA